jgi:hypothetical protein
MDVVCSCGPIIRSMMMENGTSKNENCIVKCDCFGAQRTLTYKFVLRLFVFGINHIIIHTFMARDY